jgi:hypothetical protein
VGDKIRVYLLSDIHIGNIGFHQSLFKRHVQQIAADPQGYAMLLGDVLDAVFVTDKRYAPCAADKDSAQSMRNDLINMQAEKAVALLAPLKGKILACLIGNHEEAVVRSCSVDPLRIVAHDLDAPYAAAYAAYVRLAIPTKGTSKGHKLNVDFYLHHGAGGGALSGAKINRVERRAGWFATADVVASGHNHKRSLTTNVSLSVPQASMHVQEKAQICMNTGGYLKGYAQDVAGSLYTERADLPPTELGGMVVEITLHRGHQTAMYGEMRGAML